MSTTRNLYQVVVGPSAEEFFRNQTKNESVASTESSKLPSLFTFSYNFKPDSAADSNRGALFVPGQNHSEAAEFQLELQHAPGGDQQSVISDKSSSSKSAHIFSGRQLPSKMLDLVLVWDEQSRTYQLDRLASSFAFKSERSRTTASKEASQVWSDKAAPPKRRKIAATNVADSSASSSRGHTISSSSQRREKLGSPLLRGRTAIRGQSSNQGPVKTLSPPYRRLAGMKVQAEVFADTPPASSNSSPHLRPVSMPSTSRLDNEQWQRSDRSALPSKVEPAESTTQVDSALHNALSKIASNPQQKEDERESEAEMEEALALQLESELEQEIEHVGSDSEGDVDGVGVEASSSQRHSPRSRLGHDERHGQADTPRAHSPQFEDLNASTGSLRQSLVKSRHKALHKVDNGATVTSEPSKKNGNAVIGLGLLQTGNENTPQTSPRINSVQIDDGYGDEDEEEEKEEEEDDDLNDFAAQLDMSLAEEPLTATAKERRKSIHNVSAKAVPRMSHSERRAYGLGGPRLEEEDLEDSD